MDEVWIETSCILPSNSVKECLIHVNNANGSSPFEVALWEPEGHYWQREYDEYEVIFWPKDVTHWAECIAPGKDRHGN